MPDVTTQIFNDGENDIVVHVSKSIDKTCDHDWHYENNNPEYCIKCGVSFMRYVFLDMP